MFSIILLVHYNIAVGFECFSSNTTAADNIAMGKSAMTANTTGTRNIAIGCEAYDCF